MQPSYRLSDTFPLPPCRSDDRDERARRALTQCRRHPSTDLPKRTLELRPAPARWSARPAAGRERAPRSQRALWAPRGRPAHLATEIHDGLIPIRRAACVEPGACRFRDRPSGDLVGFTAVIDPCPHPLDVRIDRGHRDAERKARDGGSRVLADAGQGTQRGRLLGYVSSEPFNDLARGSMQRHGSAWEPEPAPGTQDIGSRGPGERPDIGEPSHEGLESRYHPACLRLLQHHLAHEHLEGVRERRTRG